MEGDWGVHRQAEDGGVRRTGSDQSSAAAGGLEGEVGGLLPVSRRVVLAHDRVEVVVVTHLMAARGGVGASGAQARRVVGWGGLRVGWAKMCVVCCVYVCVC